jgi:farnesyl-diphosphate farnesyltransferase
MPLIMPGPVTSQELLKQVSRSFYLTLRILPRSVNAPISIAYLLARAADTIADTQLIQVSRRHEALQQLRASIQEACERRPGSLPGLGDLAEAQQTIAGEGTSGERALLERLGELLGLLQSLEHEDRLRIGKLLDTITRGQGNDLLIFGANPERIVALRSDEELDRYTYQVAGCVGEFWTDMCCAHVFPDARIDADSLRTKGVLFGKGLQLVNILRDLPKDLRRGRCYIPADQLATCGLAPGNLVDPSAMDSFHPVYSMYIERAESYLSAGWQYTTSLPFRYMRIRLACAWPLLIGIRTLRMMRTANILDDQHRIKISRVEIRQLMLRSAVLYAFPKQWNKLFAKLTSTNG